MLTSKERQNVLKFLLFVTTINPFPAQLNKETAEIRVDSSTKRKAWTCKVSYLLFILHSTYNNLTLMHAVWVLQNVPLYEIVVHAVFAFASLLYVYWYYILYIKQADVTAGFRSLTLTMALIEGKSVKLASVNEKKHSFSMSFNAFQAKVRLTAIMRKQDFRSAAFSQGRWKI